MHIRAIFQGHQPCFSFEFFPPRTREGAEQLYATMVDLVPLRPSYVSVTYGAGGSTRELTHDLLIRIQEETRLTVVSHMTCVGSPKEDIGGILDRYHAHGILNIMALRGDPPKGEATFQQPEGGFAHAAELVAFIKARGPVDAAALDAHCRESTLPNYKRPREYVFVQAVPKSPVGKILRRKLVSGEYEKA